VQDPDRLHVARPALEALSRVETWPESAVPALRKLSSSSNAELRQFALRSMARAPYEALVKPLTKVLLDTSAGETGEVAVEGLSRNPHALEPLMRSFLLEKDPARARRYARPLRELGSKLTDTALKAAAEKGCRLLFAQGFIVVVGTLQGFCVKQRHIREGAAVGSGRCGHGRFPWTSWSESMVAKNKTVKPDCIFSRSLRPNTAEENNCRSGMGLAPSRRFLGRWRCCSG